MLKMSYEKEMKTLQKVLESVNIPSEAIFDVNGTMRKNKKEIDDILGLTEKNNYRKEIEVSFSESDFCYKYDPIIKNIREFFDNKYEKVFTLGEDISFINNSLIYNKNKFKLSKLINKHIKDVWPTIKNSICLVRNQLTFVVTEKNFVTAFFSLTKSGSVFISTNLTDFIISSNYKWGNCYKYNGCHFNGNSVYANDSFTIILFKERNSKVSPVPSDFEKYAGRAWTYVFPKEGTLLTPISYGDLPQPYIKQARLYIEKCIAKSQSLAHKWRIYRKKPYNDFDTNSIGCVGFNNHMNYAGYFDGEKGVTVAMNRDSLLKQLSGVYIGDDVESESDMCVKTPFITFQKALCLKCGRETTKSRGGICSDSCNGKQVCELCGNKYYSDLRDNIPNNFNYVCTTCISTKFSNCNCCNNLIYTNESPMFDVSNDNINSFQEICVACYDSLYCTCSTCGVSNAPEDLITIDGQKYCKKCTDIFTKEKIVYECSCGMKHVIDNICPHNGIFITDKKIKSKKISKILETEKMKKLLEQPNPAEVICLAEEELESYFVFKLINNVLTPQLAEQLTIGD